MRGSFDDHKPCRIQLYYHHRDDSKAKAQLTRHSLKFALLVGHLGLGVAGQEIAFTTTSPRLSRGNDLVAFPQASSP